MFPMLSRLAVRNAKRSARDYLIYLVTVTFSLSMVYAFNLIVFSSEIRNLSYGMSAMTGIIIFISLIIVLVIGWLICYMTRFILEKRSREFGTYLLLGIPNRDVASLFVRENLLMGAAALMISLLVGSFLYQILDMIIMRIFQASYQIQFQFSAKALALTAGYGAAIYLFAMARVRRQLSKIKICDLLYMEKKNEASALKTGKGHWTLFLAAVAACAAGGGILWYLCHHSEEVHNGGVLLLLSVVLLIGSIYGIYMTVTSFLSKTVLAGNSFKYKKHRLFLLRNMTARMRTMGVTIGTLALLLTLTLTATSMGLLFERFFSEKRESTMSFDITASTARPSEDLSPVSAYAEEKLGIQSQLAYPLYDGGNKALTDWFRKQDSPVGWMEFAPVLAYSDYKELRQMLGYRETELKEGRYLIQCTPRIREIAEQEKIPDIRFGGETLTFQESRSEPFGVGDGFNGTGYVVIVPDNIAAKLPVYHMSLAVQTEKETTPEDAVNLVNLLYETYSYEGIDTCNTKGSIRDTYLSVFTILAFSLYYVGLIFVCAAAAVLAVHQLSEAVKYQFRYEILSKLGVGNREGKKLVFQQQLLFFGVPLMIPVPLSIFLSRQLSYWMLMNEISDKTFLHSQGISLGLFGLVYLIYFVTSWRACSRLAFS